MNNKNFEVLKMLEVFFKIIIKWTLNKNLKKFR